MVSSQPHFLLFSRADSAGHSAGRWHFLLESVDGETIVEAADEEPGLRGERLELLAVVRGLEALDQPSTVTLVTPSQRVTRGFRFGLEEWRHNRWRWERDGRWFPIKNRDLWQRVDRAMQFHRVQCRKWRFDSGHADESSGSRPGIAHGRRPSLSSVVSRGWSGLRKRITAAVRPFLVGWHAPGQWGAAS